MPYIELANIEQLSSKNEKALEIYNKFLSLNKNPKYNLPILKSRINLYLNTVKLYDLSVLVRINFIIT